MIAIAAIGAATAGCAANHQNAASRSMDAPSALTRTAAYDPAAAAADQRYDGTYQDATAAAASVRPHGARPIDPIEPFSPAYGSVDAETARTRRGDEHWQVPADFDATAEDLDADKDMIVPGYAPTRTRH